MILELCINTTEDIDKIGRWPRPHVRKIKVVARAPGAPQNIVERLSKAINRDLRACGCAEGAALCGAALAALPVLGSILSPWLPSRKLTLCGLVFAYLVTAALLGKIAGIVLAEYRLSRNIRVLKALFLSQAPENVGQVFACLKPLRTVPDASAERAANVKMPGPGQLRTAATSNNQ
jgi:hypothetical protein